MKRMYAPWRHDYVTGGQDKHKKPEDPTKVTQDACVFCQQFAQNQDEQAFILKRFEHTAVMLNRYPYNAGHVMVLPIAHKANLMDLTTDERNELMAVTNYATMVLEQVLKPQGFNVGINLGLAGGGGIPSHLHVHVLPRWRGDTNFLETLSETKVISSLLEKTYADLLAGFTQIIMPK